MRGLSWFFFFNDTATTEIYTLSLHDALPIFPCAVSAGFVLDGEIRTIPLSPRILRSEEHTSELQSPCNLVCRLLLENKTTVNSRRRVEFEMLLESCLVFALLRSRQLVWRHDF